MFQIPYRPMKEDEDEKKYKSAKKKAMAERYKYAVKDRHA